MIESATRVGVLGKYLAALATSFQHAQEPQTKSSAAVRKEARKTSPKRKRLHIIYLLNDLLHHTKYHSDSTSPFATLTGALQPYLVELFALAAGFDQQKNPKHHRRLKHLLDFWEDNGYYSKEYIDKLRETVTNPDFQDVLQSSGKDLESEKKVVPKDVPYMMPAAHGDPSAPYHELPAGNLLPHIIPNSSVPIKTQSVKALQFVAGPADETLVKAVKSLLQDVDRIYGGDSGDPDQVAEMDIDELGQVITRDEILGKLIESDAYYGWSRSFCEKMKQKREGKYQSRSPSRSRSRSRSRSYSPVKRRRYSDSSRSGAENQRRSRSRESSRRRFRRRSSYSPSPSRSRSPVRRKQRSRSQSSSYSPPTVSQRAASPPRFQQQPPFPSAAAAAPLPPHLASGQSAFKNQPQQQPNQALHPGGSQSPGMFNPPPRPPNYHGPWPPPPPPPPPSIHGGQHGFPGANPFPPQNLNMNMNIPGFGQPFMPHMPTTQFGQQPPPPPPPIHHVQHQHHPSPPQPLSSGTSPLLQQGNVHNQQAYGGVYQYPAPAQPHNPNHHRDGGRGGGRGGRGWSRGGWS